VSRWIACVENAMISGNVIGAGVAPGKLVRSVVLAAAGLLAGCFYLDTVNTAPVVEEIHASSGKISDPIVFTATVLDADGDAVGYHWTGTGCTPRESTQSTFIVMADGHNPVTATLQVTDRHHAISLATNLSTYELQAKNSNPTIDAQLLSQGNPDGTFTQTLPIEVAAQASDPDTDDKVTVSAMVHAPVTSDPNRASFVAKDKATQDWILTPDVPGVWSVELTAADDYGGVATATKMLTVVADAPPCILVTSPDATTDNHYLLFRDGGARSFAVIRAYDDLDPYPDGAAHFAWSFGPSGSAPASVAGHDLPDFAIDPAAYLPGDVLVLRVEVSDRQQRTLPCAPDQPRCSIGGNSCLQRESWEVEIR